MTPANEQDRAQVGELAQAVQEATEHSVEIAFVDAGYTGDAPAEVAKEHRIRLEVVKLPEAKRGFVPAFATMGGRALARVDQSPSALIGALGETGFHLSSLLTSGLCLHLFSAL